MIQQRNYNILRFNSAQYKPSFERIVETQITKKQKIHFVGHDGHG